MARHGTYAGYQRHLALKQPACLDCRRAQRAYRLGELDLVPTRTVLPTAWMRAAACLGVKRFTEKSIDEQREGWCDTCPVRVDCLEFGLAQPEIVRDSATFGGLTAREQIEERRRRRGDARGELDVDGFEIEPLPAAAVACTTSGQQLRVSGSTPEKVVQRWEDMVQDVTDLLDARERVETICERLGRKPETLAKSLQRAGRPDLAGPFHAAAWRLKNPRRRAD